MYYEKWYWVYIMTNRSKTLYTGVAGNITRRVFEHKTGTYEGFTSRYKLDRLVYWEKFKRVQDAIAREKQLKGWTKIKKIRLIVGMKHGGRGSGKSRDERSHHQNHRFFLKYSSVATVVTAIRPME